MTAYTRTEALTVLPAADRVEVHVQLPPGVEQEVADALIATLDALPAAGKVDCWHLGASRRMSLVGSAQYPEGDYAYTVALSDSFAKHASPSVAGRQGEG